MTTTVRVFFNKTSVRVTARDFGYVKKEYDSSKDSDYSSRFFGSSSQTQKMQVVYQKGKIVL